ncbi:hypothetical protein BI380_21930 [Delftia tsuruhatensis]|uniref:Secreted protein n=1 Tax=Delftia tsuruhatensis TaxID=180282 RepID=A0ABM6E8E4_9BURK|nr:hypothetical protein BI380_21930 [Delftia tsuruhatensis]
MACMAAMRSVSASMWRWAMSLTWLLARLLSCHRPSKVAISSMEKPRSRARRMKRRACTSDSAYWR